MVDRASFGKGCISVFTIGLFGKSSPLVTFSILLLRNNLILHRITKTCSNPRSKAFFIALNLMLGELPSSLLKVPFFFPNLLTVSLTVGPQLLRLRVSFVRERDAIIQRGKLAILQDKSNTRVTFGVFLCTLKIWPRLS